MCHPALFMLSTLYSSYNSARSEWHSSIGGFIPSIREESDISKTKRTHTHREHSHTKKNGDIRIFPNQGYIYGRQSSCATLASIYSSWARSLS